jgi:hypothetical protein
MEKIAIERALRLVDPKTDHKVRVDSSGVKFNYDGYRFTAPLPPVTKRAMLLFDSEEVLQKRAEKTGEAFQSKVRPHRYKLIAVKGTKIIPMTPERQKQINEARRRRIAAGHPDKQAYTLHERVIGMATSV